MTSPDVNIQKVGLSFRVKLPVLERLNKQAQEFGTTVSALVSNILEYQTVIGIQSAEQKHAYITGEMPFDVPQPFASVPVKPTRRPA